MIWSERKKYIYWGVPTLTCALAVIVMIILMFAVPGGANGDNGYIEAFISVQSPDFNNVKYTLIAFILILIIASPFIGWLGIGCRSGIVLTLYNLTIVAATFGILSISIISTQNYNEVQNGCESISWLQKGNACALVAERTLCKAVCPCDWPWEFIKPSDVVSSSTGPTEFGGCTNGFAVPVCKDFYQPQSDFVGDYSYYGKLADLESDLSCSGICNTAEYYLFWTISLGVPENSCGPTVIQFGKQYFLNYALLSFCLWPLLFLIMIYLSLPYVYFLIHAREKEMKLADLGKLIIGQFYRQGCFGKEKEALLSN